MINWFRSEPVSAPVLPKAPIAVDLSITTSKKMRVYKGQTIHFTANITLDGNDLVDDFDSTLDRAVDRIREMITAQVHVQ